MCVCVCVCAVTVIVGLMGFLFSLLYRPAQQYTHTWYVYDCEDSSYSEAPKPLSFRVLILDMQTESVPGISIFIFIQTPTYSASD